MQLFKILLIKVNNFIVTTSLFVIHHALTAFSSDFFLKTIKLLRKFFSSEDNQHVFNDK